MSDDSQRQSQDKYVGSEWAVVSMMILPFVAGLVIGVLATLLCTSRKDHRQRRSVAAMAPVATLPSAPVTRVPEENLPIHHKIGCSSLTHSSTSNSKAFDQCKRCFGHAHHE